MFLTDFNTIKQNFNFNKSNVYDLLSYLRAIKTKNIIWELGDSKPMMPYFCMAVTTKNNQVIIRLHEDITNFNNEYFLLYLHYILDHENIHYYQQKAMGFEKVVSVKSGYQHMMTYYDNLYVDQLQQCHYNKGMRIYLANTQELAARATNLYNEYKIVGDYKETYTWKRYKEIGFKENGKVMQKLYRTFIKCKGK